MKAAISLIAIGLIIVVWLFMRSRQNRQSYQQPASRGADPTVFLGLRNLALQGPQVQPNAPISSKPTEPYAVIMDWGVTEGTATVAAFADGTASVYLSSGGGFLGGGQSHESIRNAAKKTLEIAAELQPLMQPTHSFPLPQRGQVTFYVRTHAGVFSATASEDDLSTHRSPFSKLGDSTQAIITEYRRIQQN